MEKNILAVDIGGSKLVVGIVDSCGKVLCSEKYPLPDKYSIEHILDTVFTAATDLQSYVPAAVGVTIPGLADAENGIWEFAPFSGIGNIPIARLLSERLCLPVYIENDVNACAVGEAMYGCCRDEKDFLWITVSNGIGGALYLNGKLYTGSCGNAGEIGHFLVEENTNNRCGCGRVGCLEAMASGRAIAKSFGKEGVTAVDIAALAREGDPAAMEAFEKAGFYIGKAVASSLNLLNLSKVIIGGGVSLSFDLLEAPIRRAIAHYIFRQGNPNWQLCQTGLGYHAALIGAAAVAQCKINKE